MNLIICKFVVPSAARFEDVGQRHPLGQKHVVDHRADQAGPERKSRRNNIAIMRVIQTVQTRTYPAQRKEVSAQRA
jgi:hypothetical protein